MGRFICAVTLLVLVFGAAEPALAYIGPGAGLSLVTAFWALIATIGAALVFVILWPLRRLRRRRAAQAGLERREAGAASPSTRR